MLDKPLILNPAWESLFAPILTAQNANPRIIKWLHEMLFPYIAKNPEEFCYRLYVDSVHMSQDCAFDGDRMLEIEGYVIRTSNPMLNLNIMHDPYIVKMDTTFDNREFRVMAPGWLDPGVQMELEVARQNLRSDTRVSLLVRNVDTQLLFSSRELLLFAASTILTDLSDWLVQAARVPLTVTKLPFKEAKRLSDEWHLREERRKLRASEKYAGSPGDRELIGRLTVAPDNNIPEETYEVLWLKDEQSLTYESMIQHHCVDLYWPRVQIGQCIILHARNVNPAKREDRWTIEVAMLRMEGDKAWSSFPVVRQMRGIANCNPHPGFVTGFGNLFLHHQGEEGIGKSVLFTKESWIKAQDLVDRLTRPFGILS